MFYFTVVSYFFLVVECNMFNKSLFQNHSWIITSLVIALLTIGTITIYSTTFNATTLDAGKGLIGKQLILIIIGFLAYVFLTFFDYRWLKDPKILLLIYIFTIGLLIYVKLFTSEIAGTNRWIAIGPLTIQPAEYAKITIILTTSAILVGTNKLKYGKYRVEDKSKLKFFNILKKTILSNILLASVATSIILGLILIQPSLGNTLITFGIFTSLILVYYPDKKQLFLLILFFIIASVSGYCIVNLSGTNLMLLISMLIGGGIIYYFFKPPILELILVLVVGLMIIPSFQYAWNNIIKDYQKTRIETFIDPTKDPQGAGWQVRQSTIAIGSGRVFGKGLFQGTQSGLKILPYPHTDFIFAAYSEQFGFIGSIFLLILLLALPTTVFLIGIEHKDPFAKLITIGVGAMLLIHIFINIGMNLGKLPVTGIPLPLVSYGGSSILVNMISLGIVQNTLKYKYKDKNITKLDL